MCGVAAACLLLVHALPAAASVSRLRAADPVAVSAGEADGSAAPWAEDENLNRIIEAVQRRYNARVVRVTEVTVDGRRAYDLRLLSDQRVWMIRVDAETGQELPRSE